MKSCAALLLGLLMLPALPGTAGSVIDACRYAGDAEAAQAWTAIDQSPPATMGELNGDKVLTFHCKFSGPVPSGRHYWDRKVQLNLAEAEALQLDISCRDTGPVANFTLYFKSGNGWRSCAFSPRRAGVWETITLLKADARDEGAPAGWDAIDTLRLAAWKGGDSDTVFHIRNLRRRGVLGEDTGIVVARNESDPRDGFAGQLSALLTGIGLRHALVAESGLTPELLAKAELVMLPNNPGLPDAAAQAIAGFLEKNGRLMAFYSLPPSLRAAAGIATFKYLKPEPESQFSSIRALPDALPGAPENTPQSSWNIHAPVLLPGQARVLAEWHDADGKPTGFPAITASQRVIFMSHVLIDDRGALKPRLLLAMAGLLRPGCWQEVIASYRERMEHIARFDSFEQARNALMKQSKAGSDARRRLEDAVRLRREAAELQEQSRFAPALDATREAERLLREAYCLAQTPKAGEFRAMWCHNAYGVKRMPWDKAISILKQNGFTAIFPNMLWGGVAFYPSEVLPVAETVREKGDAVAECLAACRKHGVEMHVWKVNWNLGHAVPPSFVEQMRAGGRLQRTYAGEEQPWLCPSHPSNLELERASLLELTRNYAIDGIHFDYIRYPGPDCCFCDPCRQRFEQASGKPVSAWPADVRNAGPRREEWIAWCQENINALVRTTSEQARRIRPGIRVSAAVFRNWESDSRSVMQDWKLWCEKGWLDYLCPMNYTPNDQTFENWVTRQKQLCAGVALVPGIGASASRVSLSADQVTGQIEISRRLDTRGFIIFNYGEQEAGETIPLLGMGATRPQ